MKKTITVHIANFIFNIEEEAYLLLQDYLSKISSQFSIQEEREEIMLDIESRIAELFKDRLGQQKEVVVEQDVLEMISIMGSPEEYIVDEEEYTEASFEETEQTRTKKQTRQIYRDQENAVLGGVCSGLAAYFGIDPILIRILFIIVTVMGGSGILIYLILYFAIPEAKTIAEKLKMKGEKIDVSSIKNQFDKIKNELNDEENQKKVKLVFNRFIDLLVKFFTLFLKFFSKVVGFVFLIIGIIGLVLLVLFFNPELLSLITEKSVSISDLVNLIFVSKTHQFIVYYSMALAVLLPMGYFLSKGIQLLFKFKSSNKSLKIFLLTTWLVSVFVLVMAGTYLARNFNYQSEKMSVNIPLILTDDKPLQVDINSSNSSLTLLGSKENVALINSIQLTDEATYFQFVGFQVKPSKTDSVSLEVIKWSNGVKESEAEQLANSISYEVQLEENKLLLSNYFSFPSDEKYRGQKVKVILSIPEGKKIQFGSQANELKYSLKSKKSINNTTWVNRKSRIILVND